MKIVLEYRKAALKTNVMIYTEKKRFNNESRTQQPDFFENPTEKQILYQNSSSN